MTNAPPGSPRRSGLVLGHIRGVPIIVTPSWLLVAILLSTFYAPVIKDAVPSIGSSGAYLAGLAFAALFGLCVLLHELGHTAVSIGLGHPVRRVVLFALGGVSEIEGEPSRPRDELLIAASGPAVSLLLAGLAWLAYDASPAGELATALFGLLAWSNLLLAIFNLLPGLPLDGGRLVRAGASACGVRPANATRAAAWSGRVVAAGVAMTGIVVDGRSGRFGLLLLTLGVAAYLWAAAGQSLRYASLLERLPNIAVRELLRPGMFIPDDLPVGEALRQARAANARGLIVMDRDSHPTGIVDEVLIAAVPPDQQAWTPVSAVARPLEPGLIVPSGIDAAALLRRMQETPSREYLVVGPDGNAAGIIATRDFARRLNKDGA